MVLAPTNATPHHHLWQSEPPEGKYTWSKSWDDRYGDDEDMAANAMLTSPEETIRLRMGLKKDPDYATSSNWPSLVEWCSTCTSTRLVRLVLPEEEHEGKEAIVKEEVKEDTKVVEVEKVSCCEATDLDACTQTPRRRRQGGRGSSIKTTSCLSAVAYQEERIASVLFAHNQGNQFQAFQERGANEVVRGVCLPIAQQEECQGGEGG